jgi:replicative DNA helicase
MAEKKPGRVPPHNLEAEQALLGSILLRSDVLHDIADIVSPEVFYADKHRTIFRAMLDLTSKGNPIDLLTLSSRLGEVGDLERIGGSNYLTELVSLVPTASNAEHYAQITQKKYMMRRLIEAAEGIHGLGYDDASELEQIIDQAEKKLYEVTQDTQGSKYVQLKDLLGEAWDRIDLLHKTKGQLRGVPTGFPDLDSKLSGLQKSDLIILAARPSMGKTSLALDIARQAAIVHNIPVAIFSLEMSAHQLVDRMVAAQSRVDAWKLRTGGLHLDSEFESIRNSLDPLSKAPIYVDDQAANNILKMKAVLRRLRNQQGGLGLVIVDYLQLMAPVQSKGSDNVVQQVTEISRSLKHLAKEFNVPVLALSQLSRAVESRGGRPRLSDLRDSGSIEQDADVVMFIHREANEDGGGKKQQAEILIEKHRNGPTGMVKLYFDADKSTFLSMDKGDFGDFN